MVTYVALSQGAASATATVTIRVLPSDKSAKSPDVVVTGGNGAIAVRNEAGEALSVAVPYVGYAGAIATAVGDVTGDGVDDLVTGTLQGSSHVKLFDGATGAELRSFLAFDPSFTGGVDVAILDYDFDGDLDIAVAAAKNGGPHVRVFDGGNGTEIASFFAYAPEYTGGMSLSAGDITGDGIADLVTGTQVGTAHIKAFGGGVEFRSFYAFDLNTATGANVAVSKGRIVAGSTAGLNAEVRVFAADDSFQSFAAYSNFGGEIRVGTNSSGLIVTGAGPGGGPHVKLFDPFNFGELDSYFAFDPGFTGGVFVG
jgi:hypothetical protein